MGNWKTQYARRLARNLGSSEMSRIQQADAQRPWPQARYLGQARPLEAVKHLVDLLRQSRRKKLILEPNGVCL